MENQDKLKALIETQAQFQKDLGYDFANMDPDRRVEYIKEYAQHLDGEMFEMMRELPYFKSWKKYPTDEEAQNYMFAKAREELVDALHFFLNVIVALGFTADELYHMYCEKNGINYARQEDQENYKKCEG